MGLIAESFASLGRKAGQQQAVAASIPTWQVGQPQYPQQSYERYAREGYSKNELVYACIQELMGSAAEPRFQAMRTGQGAPEKIDRHPCIELLEHPNPFLSRVGLIKGIVLHLSIAGNAYIEKVRSGAGKVVELWLLRPDRMRVLPDAQRFIGGYQYGVNGVPIHTFDPRDVVHLKTQHPMDDYYGLPPLAVCAERVDTDSWMRGFTASFFRNAGVPAGLLNIMTQVEAQEKEMIQQRFSSLYGGPTGWHRLLVIDGGAADYKQMGMPMGDRGIAMPSLDEVNEARICMCFGVPLSLAGARLGQASSSYANRRADREMFWDETMAPLFEDLAAQLTLGFKDEFLDMEFLEVDLGEVNALKPDEDATHTRTRDDYRAGVISLQEARTDLGYEPEPPKDGIFLVPTAGMPTLGEQLLEEPEPPAEEPPDETTPPPPEQSDASDEQGLDEL